MCRYAVCRYAVCRYAECRYAVCRYAECKLKIACQRQTYLHICLIMFHDIKTNSCHSEHFLNHR